MSEEFRVLAANGCDVFRLNAVDLHEAIRSDTGPIEPLPGLEIMADAGDEYAVIQLNRSGVRNLRLALTRWERNGSPS
jgi:hypothetical protein